MVIKVKCAVCIIDSNTLFTTHKNTKQWSGHISPTNVQWMLTFWMFFEGQKLNFQNHKYNLFTITYETQFSMIHLFREIYENLSNVDQWISNYSNDPYFTHTKLDMFLYSKSEHDFWT